MRRQAVLQNTPRCTGCVDKRQQQLSIAQPHYVSIVLVVVEEVCVDILPLWHAWYPFIY